MKKAVFILGKDEKLPCGNCLMQPAHITGLCTASTYPHVGQHTASPFKPSVIEISLHNLFPHPASQLPLRDLELNLLVNKTATFLKALLAALHISSLPASFFLLKLAHVDPIRPWPIKLPALVCVSTPLSWQCPLAVEREQRKITWLATSPRWQQLPRKRG